MKLRILICLVIVQGVALSVIGLTHRHPTSTTCGYTYGPSQKTCDPIELTQAEIDVLATHEAGHAVAAWVYRDLYALGTVTTVTNGGTSAIGYTEVVPIVWTTFEPRSVRMKAMTIRFASRAAEELVYGEPQVISEHDVSVATDVAMQMLKRSGTNTEEVDTQELHRMLATASANAKILVSQNRAGLDALRMTLVVRRTLSGAEASEIIATGEPHLYPSYPTANN